MIRYIPVELHCHTLHSDGDFTPAALMEAARDFGCGAIALTDHNTASGMQEITPKLQARLLPVVPGIEWTTFYGHMLVLGARRYVDWRFARPETIDRFTAQINEADGVVGIAHPFSMGGVLYTGGFWEFQVRDWSKISYIEVWHVGENDERLENARALAWWKSLLNEGHRLAAVSGRDWHRPDAAPRLCAVTYVGIETGEDAPAAVPNEITSPVAAPAGGTDSHAAVPARGIDSPAAVPAGKTAASPTITPEQIKAALRAGRTFITFGPTIRLEVRPLSGQNAPAAHGLCPAASSSPTGSDSVFSIGDTVPAGSVQITVYVDENARRSHWAAYALQIRAVRLVTGKGTLAELPYTPDAPVCWQGTLSDGWLCAELRGSHRGAAGDDTLLGMTSAIYVRGE